MTSYDGSYPPIDVSAKARLNIFEDEKNSAWADDSQIWGYATVVKDNLTGEKSVSKYQTLPAPQSGNPHSLQNFDPRFSFVLSGGTKLLTDETLLSSREMLGRYRPLPTSLGPVATATSACLHLATGAQALLAGLAVNKSLDRELNRPPLPIYAPELIPLTTAPSSEPLYTYVPGQTWQDLVKKLLQSQEEDDELMAQLNEAMRLMILATNGQETDPSQNPVVWAMLNSAESIRVQNSAVNASAEPTVQLATQLRFPFDDEREIENHLTLEQRETLQKLRVAFPDFKENSLWSALMNNEELSYGAFRSDKIDHARELLTAAGNYISGKHLRSIQKIRDDVFLKAWFASPTKWASISKSKALLAGELKEFRGMAWFAKSFPNFVYHPILSPRWEQYLKDNHIDPDGLYQIWNPATQKWITVVVEVKAMGGFAHEPPLNDRWSLPTGRGRSMGHSVSQFLRSARTMENNPNLHLHYVFFSDRGTRVTSPSREDFFKNYLLWSLGKQETAYSILERINVTWAPYINRFGPGL